MRRNISRYEHFHTCCGTEVVVVIRNDSPYELERERVSNSNSLERLKARVSMLYLPRHFCLLGICLLQCLVHMPTPREAQITWRSGQTISVPTWRWLFLRSYYFHREQLALTTESKDSYRCS